MGQYKAAVKVSGYVKNPVNDANRSKQLSPRKALKLSPWQPSLGNSMAEVYSMGAAAAYSAALVQPLIMVYSLSAILRMRGLFEIPGEVAGVRKAISECLAPTMPRPSPTRAHRME